MEQSHAGERPSEKSFRMTCCIECPDYGCRPPSFEWVKPDETILFVTGMPSAQERVNRHASDLRSSDCIDGIPLSDLGFVDLACATRTILMRQISKAAVALH